MASYLAALCIATACVGGPALAAADEPDPSRVLLWHSYRGGEREALEQVVRRLHAANSDVTVDLLAVPNEAFRQRLTAAIPRGNGPDLFIAPHESVGEWSRNHLLEAMPYPADLPEAAFLASSRDALTFDGQLWAVPLSFKSLALFINRGLVKQTPGTVEELVALGRAAGEVPLAYEAGNFYHHAAVMHAFGVRLFGEDGSIQIDTAEMADSLAFAGRLVGDGSVPPESDGALVSNLFNSGTAPFVINGPWFLGEIRDEIDFAVEPLPTVAATGQPLQPFLTVEALYLAAQRRASTEAVHAVVRAIAGLEGSLLRARVGRQTVPLIAAGADPVIADDPVLSAFVAQGAQAVATPNRPEMGAIWEPMNRALRRALRGSDARKAVVEAQQEVSFYLRPPPEEAAPGPYLALLGLLLLGATGWSLRSLKRNEVVSRLPSAIPAYLYLLPAALGMTLVVFLPFLAGAAVSLFAHVGGEFTFVGLRNFGRILSSSEYGVTHPLSFWFTLVVTVAWTLANVVLHVSIGLGLALLLRDPWMKLKGVYRVLLIVPWAVPNYITALIWKGMFNRQFGAVNAFLDLFGVEPISWFSNFFTSFAANVATNTWLGFPFMMVVTLGALQAIPRDLIEAAEVDGANAWQRFRHVTLPLLKPALLPAVILGSVWTFNMFNIIYLVSAGEPDGSTEILISEAYKWAFTRQAQYGYASAYALLIFGILWLWGLLTQRVTGAEA
ncbi:MAG: extracellular solute-binding protein [Deltaproteobacteria bacterium]|nr:extracellular solute-binding protein [Deltaproteobacteria bacterium]